MRLGERLLQAAIVVAGVASIVATGGGGGNAYTECSFFSSAGCFPGTISPPPVGPSTVTLSPVSQTVLVGTSATIKSTTDAENPRYQWCRAERGSNQCSVLPDGTGATYTIAAARVEDDGARFRVTVTGSRDTAMSGFSELLVSSLPQVVFQDGEFLEAEWTMTLTQGYPPQSPPTVAVSRAATGGNPGAFRLVAYDMPQPGYRSAEHIRTADTYYPTSQGAIYHLDFALDCVAVPSTAVGLYFRPIFEQDGRLYSASHAGGRCEPAWKREEFLRLFPQDFLLAEGPECPAGRTCPDFSATAAPIHFGFSSSIEHPPALAGRSQQDFDNWKVTVWRK